MTITPRFPDAEDIMVIGVDLTKRGGRAAAKAIESNQAKVNQKNDEPIREACGGSTLQNAYLN